MSCAAFNCKNRAKNGYLVFPFPRNIVRRKEWARRCCRKGWQPTDYSKICEVRIEVVISAICAVYYENLVLSLLLNLNVLLLKVHFPPDQWETGRADGRRKLKPNAVPLFCNKVRYILVTVSSLAKFGLRYRLCAGYHKNQ